MHLDWESLKLELVLPFRIAHGTSHERHNVLVRLDGALGEAAAVPYHGETPASIGRYLLAARELLARVPTVESLDEVRAIVERLPAGSDAGRAAIDMALCDLWGRSQGQPLYALLGLDASAVPLTSFTLPLDEPDAMAERARALGGAPLKIKLGGDDGRDGARLARIRRASRSALRVDANAGLDVATAERLMGELADHDVELVEQPLAVGDLEGLRRLSKVARRPPIFVDESIKTLDDVERHAGIVDGVVVKLAKSGGVIAALDQMRRARELGLQVMIGCMIESSVAVTAAAQLAPLADYADLDGPTLVRNDPVRGLGYGGGAHAGRLILPSGPGLGLEPR